MGIAIIVLSALLAVVFVVSGVMKLAGAAPMRASAEHLGIDFARFRLIGLPEIAGAAGLIVGLWYWPLAVAAAIGLALLMVGAVVFHVRARDGVDKFGAAAVLGVISLAVAIMLPLAG